MIPKSISDLTGWHIIVAVVILAALGEFTKGIVSKVAWGLAAVIVVIHALRVFSSK